MTHEEGVRRQQAGAAFRRRERDPHIHRGPAVRRYRPVQLPAGTTDVFVLVDDRGKRWLWQEIDFALVEHEWAGMEVVRR